MFICYDKHVYFKYNMCLGLSPGMDKLGSTHGTPGWSDADYYVPESRIDRRFIFILLPKCIINGFLMAAINAVFNIFPKCKQTGCKSTWRKIQSSGLATQYGNDIEFGLKLRCL